MVNEVVTISSDEKILKEPVLKLVLSAREYTEIYKKIDLCSLSLTKKPEGAKVIDIVTSPKVGIFNEYHSIGGDETVEICYDLQGFCEKEKITDGVYDYKLTLLLYFKNRSVKIEEQKIHGEFEFIS